MFQLDRKKAGALTICAFILVGCGGTGNTALGGGSGGGTGGGGGDSPSDGGAALESYAVAASELLTDLEPLAPTQDLPGLSTVSYDGYAVFAYGNLSDFDAEDPSQDIADIGILASKMELTADLNNLELDSGRFYEFVDQDGEVEGEVNWLATSDIAEGNILDVEFGGLTFSDSATGNVDGKQLAVTLDGGFLGDDGQGVIGLAQGEYNNDDLVGAFAGSDSASP